MPVDYTLTDGEADSRAGDFGVSVESLEDSEDSLRISLIESYAVVPNGKRPSVTVSPSVNIDSRACIGTELQGVADDVLEQLPQL